MPSLLMFAPAPVIQQDNRTLVLDRKFVTGMKMHCEYWAGPITFLLRKGAQDIPFGATYDKKLFNVELIGEHDTVPRDLLLKHDLIVCSGDSVREFELPSAVSGTGRKIVFVIEYTIGTRLAIARLDRSRSLVRKMYQIGWNVVQERRRRRAFRGADGLQANGYPAFEDYGSLTGNSMLYLDNRMTSELFASEPDMAARENHLRSGSPIRIVHSGRLEAMKGAQDLVAVARWLKDRQKNFTLDIYGTGSLEAEISADIARSGLEDQVRLHGPVDFATELVPICRSSADVFLSCHRQADPSCTYLESMGCGLSVIGYDNRMWSALLKESQGGWKVPMGRPGEMADMIARIDGAREELIRRCRMAWSFAKQHDFQAVFEQRMNHLRTVVDGSTS